MTHLNYHSTENGFCKVLYTGPKHHLPRFCIQKTLGDEYEILSCSPDGEPDSPVTLRSGVTFALPGGDTPTDREVRQWLTKQGLSA